MKKKKSNKLCSLIFSLFALISIATLFIPVLNLNAISGSVEKSFNGFNVAFGYKETAGSGSLSITTTLFAFSILNLIPYLLACAVLALGVMNYKKSNDLFVVLAVVLSLAAAILFVFVKNFAVVESVILSAAYENNVSLAIGSYIAIAGMALSAIFGILKIALKK